MIIRRESISLSMVRLMRRLMRLLAASYPCLAGGVGGPRDVIKPEPEPVWFLLLARHGARSLS